MYKRQVLLTLKAIGVSGIEHHDAVDGGPQGLRLAHAELVRAADNVMKLKHVVRNVARRHGCTATFMPAPVAAGMRAGGMRVDQSLWKGGQTLFFGEGTKANLSQTARWYIGGLLRHMPSLLAFSRSTTNSYRRPGEQPEAPERATYASGDRSVALRVPSSIAGPQDQRVQFRWADGLANPYLAFSAMVMAGLDGIRHQIDPGGPAEAAVSPGDADGAPEGPGPAPRRLEEALEALDHDRDYLLEGEVFGGELIDTWIGLKQRQIRAICQRPHPLELSLHVDG